MKSCDGESPRLLRQNCGRELTDGRVIGPKKRRRKEQDSRIGKPHRELGAVGQRRKGRDCGLGGHIAIDVKGVNGPRKIINVEHLDDILRCCCCATVASVCLGIIPHSHNKLPKTLRPVEQQSHPAHLSAKRLAFAVKLKVAVRDAY